MDGTQKAQLTVPPMQAYLPRRSPDGSQITFFGHPPGEPSQICVIPATGGIAEQVYRTATNLADPNWSRHGRSVYFHGILDREVGFLRVQISDRKVERILSLTGFQATVGPFGNWSGVAPDESPLFVRDASIQEIYGLDWAIP